MATKKQNANPSRKRFRPATEMVHGEFLMPSGMPAPVPSKTLSSVMNMISSENALPAIEVSTF